MTDRTPYIVYSGLGGYFSKDGIDVAVFIVKLEGASE